MFIMETKKRLTEEVKKEIADTYQTGLSSRQVADMFGVCKYTVIKIIKDKGLKPRHTGRQIKYESPDTRICPNCNIEQDGVRLVIR
jgi:transposase